MILNQIVSGGGLTINGAERAATAISAISKGDFVYGAAKYIGKGFNLTNFDDLRYRDNSLEILPNGYFLMIDYELDYTILDPATQKVISSGKIPDDSEDVGAVGYTSLKFTDDYTLYYIRADYYNDMLYLMKITFTSDYRNFTRSTVTSVSIKNDYSTYSYVRNAARNVIVEVAPNKFLITQDNRLIDISAGTISVFTTPDNYKQLPARGYNANSAKRYTYADGDKICVICNWDTDGVQDAYHDKTYPLIRYYRYVESSNSLSFIGEVYIGNNTSYYDKAKYDEEGSRVDDFMPVGDCRIIDGKLYMYNVNYDRSKYNHPATNPTDYSMFVYNLGSSAITLDRELQKSLPVVTQRAFLQWQYNAGDSSLYGGSEDSDYIENGKYGMYLLKLDLDTFNCTIIDVFLGGGYVDCGIDVDALWIPDLQCFLINGSHSLEEDHGGFGSCNPGYLYLTGYVSKGEIALQDYSTSTSDIPQYTTNGIVGIALDNINTGSLGRLMYCNDKLDQPYQRYNQ